MSRRNRNKQETSNAPGATAPKAAVTEKAAPFSIGSLIGYSLLLAAVASVLYLPISGHPFINFDDGPYILDNANIHSGVNLAMIRWAFTSFYAANWHPLTWLVHAADFAAYATDAGGHHVTSLFFHAANVVLLFLVLTLTTRALPQSFVTAALFAVHPLNVESVAWAAELKNLLCTFFFLLTIGAYVWYARRPMVIRYLIVALAFACGLAAKPMVITLPFVLLLLDFWPLARFSKLVEPAAGRPTSQQSSIGWLLLEKLPLLLLSAVSAWVTILAQIAGETTTMIRVPLGLRIENAIVSYAAYLGTFLVPVHLAPFYPFPVHGIPVWRVVLSTLVMVVISATAFRLGWKSRAYLIAGWLWFLGTLIPVIGIFQVGAQSRADRYAYIPMIGLLMMVVWSAAQFVEERKWTRVQSAVPAAVVAAILFSLTWVQISHWDTPFDLWSHTIAVTGDNPTAEHNITIDLIRTRRYAEAFPHLVRAVELDPEDMVSHVNLGNAYSSQGKQKEALHEFEIVFEKSKDSRLILPAAIDAGWSYMKEGELAKAEAAYRLALTIAPSDPGALRGLVSVQQAQTSARSGEKTR